MKVIIAGSRTINSYADFDYTIKSSGFGITEIVCGLAEGVDLLGKAWAEVNHIPVKEFPANWTKFGRSAGPIRNAEMAQYADALIAIWDGKSRGTKNMIDTMKHYNKPCYVVYMHKVGGFYEYTLPDGST